MAPYLLGELFEDAHVPTRNHDLCCWSNYWNEPVLEQSHEIGIHWYHKVPFDNKAKTLHTAQDEARLALEPLEPLPVR